MNPYLELFLVLAAGIFVGRLIFGGGPVWRRVIAPEGVNRGPNADSMYEGIEVKGERYQFVEHELDQANDRAGKFWR